MGLPFQFMNFEVKVNHLCRVPAKRVQPLGFVHALRHESYEIFLRSTFAVLVLQKVMRKL